MVRKQYYKIYVVKSNNILANNQCGFRKKNQSTIDQPVNIRLETFFHDAFVMKEDAFFAFFDFI